jgi:hypothetical protein
VYYGVVGELERMRLWLLADPFRRKTRRGVKRFIFLWVSKTCARRPKAAAPMEKKDGPVAVESRQTRMERLAELKAVLK